MNYDPYSYSLHSLARKGMGFIRGFGRRILVHIGAFTAACVVFSIASSRMPGDMTGAAILVYFGLICLFPRGNFKDPKWYLPTLVGMAQCLVLVLLGLPWPLMFYWGGLQTWLQRLIQFKGHMGWEWTAVPVLTIGIAGFFRESEKLNVSPLSVWSFPVIVVMGIWARKVYVRRKMEPIHRALLAEAIRTLRKLSDKDVLPPELRQQVDLLVRQGTAYGKAVSEMGHDGCELARGIEQISQKLEALSHTLQPREWSPAMNQVLGEIREMNAALMQRVQDAPPLESFPFEPQTPLPEELTARIDVYEDSSRKLLLKQQNMPEHLRRHVEGIATTTFKILQCMRDDPHDRVPGDKFLNKYLTSVHMVVDEYIRLSDESVVQHDVLSALARSEDILARLEEAFKHEHGELLQNDAISYTAELSTLDTLLKMRGQ